MVLLPAVFEESSTANKLPFFGAKMVAPSMRPSRHGLLILALILCTYALHTSVLQHAGPILPVDTYDIHFADCTGFSWFNRPSYCNVCPTWSSNYKSYANRLEVALQGRLVGQADAIDNLCAVLSTKEDKYGPMAILLAGVCIID